jgi:hypothetical protein
MTLGWGKQPKQSDPEIQRMQQAIAWCSYCAVFNECNTLREESEKEPVDVDAFRIDGIMAGRLVQWEPSVLGSSVQKFLVDGETRKIKRGGRKAATLSDFQQWSHELDENGCLLWLGKTTRSGTGFVNYQGKREYPRRRNWELANGPLKEGQRVKANCGNAACGSLDHLYVTGGE